MTQETVVLRIEQPGLPDAYITIRANGYETAYRLMERTLAGLATDPQPMQAHIYNTTDSMN